MAREARWGRAVQPVYGRSTGRQLLRGRPRRDPHRPHPLHCCPLPVQLCKEKGEDLSVCVIEKGAEVGKLGAGGAGRWRRRFPPAALPSCSLSAAAASLGQHNPCSLPAPLPHCRARLSLPHPNPQAPTSCLATCCSRRRWTN